MTRRKPTRYVPIATDEVAETEQPRTGSALLAWLDDYPPVLTVEEAAGILRREPRTYLEDPKAPRLPLNRKEIRVLRESLRAYLEERLDTVQAAFIQTVRGCPTVLDGNALAELLRTSEAEASDWAAEIRGGRRAE